MHMRVCLYLLAFGCLSDTTTAVEALEKGLDAVMQLCDVVAEEFVRARDAFDAAEADRMVA